MTVTKKSKKSKDGLPIVVIGGGPAGMTAAQAAVGIYGNVLLYDKNPFPGKKLQAVPLETVFMGEKLPPDNMADAFGDKSEFIKPALKAFGWKELQQYLSTMGINISQNGSSHLKADPVDKSDLSSILKNAAENAGVAIRKSCRVTDIVISKNSVKGIIVNGIEHPAVAVIVACGSFSSPGRGSTNDGYSLAQRAGHTVNPIKPALLGLETVEKFGKILSDIDVDKCAVEIQLNGQAQLRDVGQIKFTRFGLDGELILTHSAKIIEMLNSGKVEIHIDFIPRKNRKDIEEMINEKAQQTNRITIGEILKDYLPENLLQAAKKVIRIPHDKPAAHLSNLEKKGMILWLKDFHFTIRRPRPFSETKGVLGGVSVDEIDPQTLRSKLIPNLYFAGEVLDLLGPWGGYNIQMAFATGYVAGQSAASELVKKSKKSATE